MKIRLAESCSIDFSMEKKLGREEVAALLTGTGAERNLAGECRAVSGCKITSQAAVRYTFPPAVLQHSYCTRGEEKLFLLSLHTPAIFVSLVDH